VTSGTVTPIATATNTAGAPITVGRGPIGIAITPNGKTAYVTNYIADTVTPIATATNTAGAPITVGRGPIGIAITPNGKTAYVTSFEPGVVTPIATATNTAGAPITVADPEAIAITPKHRHLHHCWFYWDHRCWLW
jgi:YVTN family beta-propeller protein